ncbi:hypothetical protein Q0Z83_021810 [Actinoplanes sichuanensis]|uniref:Uncharacterized protein n=1 Tax=Actinoplanes sichuanensis TaxID=512349 RepID=A0ABW4AKM8_9ACTN|nr:hypothetical protein [Actinoplanes sichuanensis]BEL03990.1 hypothetical protein Q0Z83_021810 [Actinoplanes sichuanensis]
MSAPRIELPPFQFAPIVYPSIGRAILESSLTVGRTVLVTGLGLGLLIGFAMLIAFALTTGAGALGFQAG